VLRAQPGVFGLVASDPTVSRLIARLATDADAALATIAGAQATVWDRVWGLTEAGVQDGQLVLDLGRDPAYRALGETRHDADLEDLRVPPPARDSQSRHRWSRGPVAELLRPGNAGSNTAADHVAAHDAALGPLPVGLRASTSRVR